jgi:ketosteroid isomerase-like protein
MSTAANKKLIQEIYFKLAMGDGSLFAAHLADNVIMRVTGQNSWSRTYHGKESLLRDHYGYFRSLTRAPRKTIPINVFVSDDHVAVEARGDMVSNEGTRYDNEYCMIFKLENGNIVEMREYLDSALCERVLGAFPASAP